MVTIMVAVPARVREKVRVDIRCPEECGHRACGDCGGGHFQKVIGRDGLCESCREWRIVALRLEGG